jgi:hypothetical protein
MNPFSIILVITGFLILTSMCVAVVAPDMGFSMPTAPEFPNIDGSGFNWTFTLTDWSAIGSVFLFVGYVFLFFIDYLVFMVMTLSVLFQIIGVFPLLASGLTAVIIIAFGGSLLMFLRGSGSGGVTK